jgi:hypothetical protein
MSRHVPSSSARQSALRSHRFAQIFYGSVSICVYPWLRSLSSLAFIGDEIAREEFDHAFRGAHEWGYVKANVHSTRNQAFPPDLVTSQTKGKD